MTRRTRRSVAGSVLVVLGLVIGAVVVTALQAEGRERSKADTNDGGAWLLKRDEGYVGHVNRVVGEVTAAVSVVRSRAPTTTSTRRRDVIVVHDRTRGTVTVVDDSIERIANPAGLQVDANTTVHAVDGGALDRRPGLDDGVEDRPRPTWCRRRRPTRSSRSSAARARRCRRPRPTATPCSPTRRPARSCSCDPDGTTDDQPGARTSPTPWCRSRRSATTPPCWPTPTATCSWPRPTRPRRSPSTSPTPTANRPPSILQQPGAGADHVVAATTDGRLVALPLAGGREHGDRPARRVGPDRADRVRRVRVRRVDGAGDVRPVVRRPATAGWAEVQTIALDGAGSELRLRLVNGWVWINDVDSGAAWVTSPQQRLDRVEDWGNILSDLDDDIRREQHRRRRRRGHHRGQPGRPERRDRAVRRDRRGRPEPPADRPRRRDPDPRRPADRRRRAGQRHRSQRRRPDRHGGRTDRRRRGDRRSTPTGAACRSPRPPASPGRSRSTTRSPTAATRARRRRSRCDVRSSDGSRQPPAGGPQRHRLDPPRPPDDVRRAGQRRRPRRRRPGARRRSPSPTRRPAPACSCSTRPARSCSRRTPTARRSASS